METIRRLAWRGGGLLAIAAVALVACGGKLAVLVEDAGEQGGGVDAAAPTEAHPGPDAGTASRDSGPPDGGAELDAEAGAGADGAGAACVAPTLPYGYFCMPPGGTISSAFDPAACIVDAGDSCRAHCAAWFGSPLEDTYCTAADGPYIDAGPAGWVVCGCNIP